MSWLRGITSAALNSTARSIFSARPISPFRMLSNAHHLPTMLDKAKTRDETTSDWNITISDTIDRTADAAQKAPQTLDELWAERSRTMILRAPADPFTGRRVFVNDQLGLGDAFRRLQTRLKRNRVVQEVSRQRRHEKKGVKRRRLSSERWRRVFANEVRKKVQLVSTIRRRGAY